MRNVTPKEKQKNSETSEQSHENEATLKPSSEKEASIAMLSHLLTLLVWFKIPGLNIIATLALLMFCKAKYPYAVQQTKESLNFQITLTIGLIISMALIPIGIGLFTMPFILIASLILSFIAAIKSNKGVAYRYPWTVRLIS